MFLARQYGVSLATSQGCTPLSKRIRLLPRTRRSTSTGSTTAIQKDAPAQQGHHDMSTHTARSTGYQIYPKRYFDASPTWFKWNNLSAADVHALRSEPGFEGQAIYFHMNHPIRFVRLIGLVVDIEVKASKYVILSLDDGSGACIEIKTTLRENKAGNDPEYPSNTLVDNLDVRVGGLGGTTVSIDKQPITVGTVIKAKGTLDTFREERQLKLERVWIVKDTTEEVKAWAETASWKRDVLSKPWVLTQELRDEIEAKNQRDALAERAKAKKREARGAEYEERKRQKLEKMERRRKRDEQRYNAGALPGSSVVPTRVTDS